MAGTAGQYPDTMTTPVTYLEYPDTLKDPKGVQHWIEFKGRDFKSGKTTLNIAMYMPNDALSTSYKSSYESTYETPYKAPYEAPYEAQTLL